MKLELLYFLFSEDGVIDALKSIIFFFFITVVIHDIFACRSWCRC